MLSWRPGARRWYRVTVDRDPDEVIGNGLPAPLAGLRRQAELRIRPAADGRGTELAARLRKGAATLATLTGYLSGEDPRVTLRTALLHAKRLVESAGDGRGEPSDDRARLGRCRRPARTISSSSAPPASPGV